MHILNVSLNLKDDMVRAVIETENYKRDAGIDFDNGFPDCADNVLKEILGEISKIDWQSYIKQLVKQQN